MAKKAKKYTVLDLFCGCGGISYGFEMAGFEIIGGVDFNKDATDTFKLNFPSADVRCADISTISDREIKKAYHGVDVIVGGPPCQGFSTANRYQKEVEDPRNKLFFQYIRFVSILKPKIILIENVRGILTRDNGYAKERIASLLKEQNYELSMQVLDASEYGVPQCRKRAIMVGIRQDYLEEVFNFDILKTSPKVTVAEALSDLYSEESDLQNKQRVEPPATCTYQEYLKEGSEFIFDHEIHYPASIVQERISYVDQGGNWRDVPEHLWPSNRKNRHSSAYKRLREDTQSCTIDTGNAHSNYFHPLYNSIFDRDTLILREFSINLLFIIAAYAGYEEEYWKSDLHRTIRELFIKSIDKEYEFFILIPQNEDINKFHYLYYEWINGKAYTLESNSKNRPEHLLLAFERTDTGKKDKETFLSQKLREYTTGKELLYDLRPITLAELNKI